MALVCSKDLPYLPFITIWSIWFLSWWLGDSHVNLWSLCLNRVLPITCTRTCGILAGMHDRNILFPVKAPGRKIGFLNRIPAFQWLPEFLVGSRYLFYKPTHSSTKFTIGVELLIKHCHLFLITVESSCLHMLLLLLVETILNCQEMKLKKLGQRF